MTRQEAEDLTCSEDSWWVDDRTLRASFCSNKDPQDFLGMPWFEDVTIVNSGCESCGYGYTLEFRFMEAPK